MPAAEGVMLGAGEGERIVGKGLDITVKATMDPAMTTSFEVVIPPGYDVGAHVHGGGEEIFFIVEGELEFLVFEPVDRTEPDWHRWESPTGRRFIRGGPGTFMFVPPGVPHAFGNPTDQPSRMFFQSSVPGGHEHYFEELAAILDRSDSAPDQADIEDLRRRYDIEQLTPRAGGAAPAGS
jgi:oxalate decarboxylase/phosphoglucose isomerase-like protein (cupin superfamily)